MKRIVMATLTSLCLLTACGTKAPVGETAVSQSSSSAQVKRTVVTHQGDYYTVKGQYGEVIIVNKRHPLSATYAPGENPVALSAFHDLIEDMQTEGFAVSEAYSGFRSYDTQSELYESYVARDGQDEADRYSARPGFSEHQTGLAFDVLDSSGELLEEPEASQWLREHAHEYGFIVRYLPGKEDVTGYMAESWHLRYIGQEAKDIAESGLSLEEYFDIPGGDYLD